MIEHELQPWIILTGSSPDWQPALWQLSQSETASLAMFSTEQRAEQYAAGLATSAYRITQPARLQLISLLAACYQQGIRIAVLDPAAQEAKRAFDLKAVLKAAREEVRSLKFEV